MTGRLSIASIRKSVASIERPVTYLVEIDLPAPPSVNALTFNREGGRSKTKAYREWIIEAGWRLQQQKPGRIAGKYILVLGFERLRSNADLGNREKGLSDLLVRHGVIEDDRFAEMIISYWSNQAIGVHVTVRAVR